MFFFHFEFRSALDPGYFSAEQSRIREKHFRILTTTPPVQSIFHPIQPNTTYGMQNIFDQQLAILVTGPYPCRWFDCLPGHHRPPRGWFQ